MNRTAAEAATIRAGDPTRQKGDTLHAGRLGLGDVVTLDAAAYMREPFGDSTVIDKTETAVKLFRPYVHTSDVAYGGGLIPYVGVNTYEMPLDTPVLLVRKVATEIETPSIGSLFARDPATIKGTF